MIYFTSDTHFNHDKEFCWKVRGFNSVEEMNTKIMENWNATITDEDEVYLLGDVMLGDYQKGIDILSKLKGKIHIILGNHDTAKRIELYRELPNVVEIVYSTLIKIGKQHYYLSHYPSITSNYDDKPYHSHIINLYGHTHQPENFFYVGDPLYTYPNPFMYHVGVDSHNCYPVSIEQINKDIHDMVNELYKIKVQQEKEAREFYENGLGYFENHPLGEEIL